jgi:hypothetical protein
MVCLLSEPANITRLEKGSKRHFGASPLQDGRRLFEKPATN